MPALVGNFSTEIGDNHFFLVLGGVYAWAARSNRHTRTHSNLRLSSGGGHVCFAQALHGRSVFFDARGLFSRDMRDAFVRVLGRLQEV